MIKVKLQELLDKEERSLRWVSTKTGITYSTLYNFNQNKTTSVSYDVLNKLCILFNCRLEDVIEYTKDE